MIEFQTPTQEVEELSVAPLTFNLTVLRFSILFSFFKMGFPNSISKHLSELRVSVRLSPKYMCMKFIPKSALPNFHTVLFLTV